MSASHTIRRRLETQGYHGLSDAALEELSPWLRFAPVLGTVVIGVGTALRSPTLLWALAMTTAVGAVFPLHPFELLYNHLVRRVTRTRPLPPGGPPRRFSCAVAAAWLAVTGLAFHVGSDALGLLLGSAITLVAGLLSVTHVCLPSTIYNAIRSGRPVRRARARDALREET
jgi:hypothetical protein